MKSKKHRPQSRTITYLKMSSGRVVRDPEEINRLLVAEGFTIGPDGKLGVSERLAAKHRQ